MRFAAVLVPLLAMAVPAGAEPLAPVDKAAYGKAFKSAAIGHWADAERHAAQANEDLPRKALRWLRIVDGKSNVPFAEIVAFVEANPHWPNQYRMRHRAEEAMSEEIPDAAILAWFAKHEPVSGDGAFHKVRALLNANRVEEATTAARKAWIGFNMTPRVERAFRHRFRKLLREEDHVARLDRLLWDQQTAAARAQLRHMSHDYQWLGLARIALMRREPGVDHAVSKVPKRLVDDPGLIYERVRWRRKHGLEASAIELLKTAAAPRADPHRWWQERRILARWLLHKGHVSEAYDLVKAHGQTDGLGFAEAEWLAGWIALRSLNQPVDAFDHFRRMYEKVSYPVSRARAAYWAGRAAEAAGKPDISQQWYAVAAIHVTTFYGQLAAAKLPKETRPGLPAEPVLTEPETATFDQLELVRLVGMMTAIGLSEEIDPFVRKLAEDAGSPAEWKLIASLAEQSERQDLAVHVAKEALKQGVVLWRLGYPDLGLNAYNAPDPAFIKAIVRQESAFNPRAISHAGARGLMQLMPATAHQVARQLSVPYSKARLIGDPDYNITIGRAYLASLLANYKGSPILALAAYNAGPYNAARWVRDFGDPTRSVEDAVDWIESIPYYETRNYVQRVLENFTVYRGRRDGVDLILSLADSLAPPAAPIVVP